jgi:SAM-dependent methyltransferase
MPRNNLLYSLLAYPLGKNISLDDPRTTLLRRRIIREKKFLEKIYQDWYRLLIDAIPAGQGTVLELGSGAGFLKEIQKTILTTEVFSCPGIDAVLDAQHLPFPQQSILAILMVDVLHHLPSVREFFRGANRCVLPGGVMAMIEPWNTSWSRWVYQHLHHEPFDPQTPEWEFSSTGPLSGANSALPWIVFVRDRSKFESEFPGWKIEQLKPMMPFRYLVSGGVAMRPILPGGAYSLVCRVEKIIERWMNHLGMFAFIQLRRNATR